MQMNAVNFGTNYYTKSLKQHFPLLFAPPAESGRMEISMKLKKLLLPACLILFLTGCTSTPKNAADGQKWQEEWTKIGTSIGIEVPDQLTLLEQKDTLAADGLYYATWVSGDSVPYKNSDNKTVDLYDAQLYFLTDEAESKEKAKKRYDVWLSAAKENYNVDTEKSVTLNGQTYTLITYSCTSKDNPYDHGISAFGICGTTTVCTEFTCLENYTQDLEALLTEFLNGCHFAAE